MRQMYQISDAEKFQYAGLFLLDQLSEGKEEFSVSLPEDQQILEPIFQWLLNQKYTEINAYQQYQLTRAGTEILRRYRTEYRHFLQESDIYCAVDLETGDFAMSDYEHFESQEAWENFLNDERWEDLRIAVSAYQGIDPIGVIFMDFISRGHFGRDEHGFWSYDRLLGKVWDEIKEISNGALHTADLAYEDEGELISGDEVIRDIIRQGNRLRREQQPASCDIIAGLS
ncbi:MAG: hypothetical protein H6618_06035 [Deltaproteobacteria bacterium]|nr:hypothetical protein [Deltaproteobacteria bacterium]